MAAGSATTEVPDAAPNQPIPYSGQISNAADFDGTGVTRVEVTIDEVSSGD